MKGPFPEGTILVSWDVIGMFPNIDNNLGIAAITKALNNRAKKLPPPPPPSPRAKSGTTKPELWWGYRDNIFDIWTQGLQKLLGFTDFINSLYPTINSHLNIQKIASMC
jgi:hypothetical protein